MIFDSITLHDFGVYAGRQALQLTPKSPEKPVVLIGALNGSGKTTLLDAIHLGLYGIRAQTSNRNGAAYPQYLRDCINKKARPSDGARVELKFRHRKDGAEHEYQVSRSWAATGSSVRESLEVLRNGKLDEQLTESWAEQVEEFLPLGLSRLFLFDGEKIEAMADLKHSAATLATAISSLLGLEVVDQLGSDLATLEQKKRVAQKGATDRVEIEALQARLHDHEQKGVALRARRATLVTDLEQREKQVRELEEDFRKRGGDTFQRREILAAERSSIETNIQNLEITLVDEAAEGLPLALAEDLLKSVSHQAGRETVSREAKLLDGVLAERDDGLLAVVKKLRLPAGGVQQLQSYLAQDRERRVGAESPEAYLSLSSEATTQLGSLLSEGLSQAQHRARQMVDDLRALQDALVQIERKLQAVPDEGAIQRYIDGLEKARVAAAVSRSELQGLDAEIAEAQKQLETDRERLSRLIEKTVDVDFEREDSGRVAQHAARIRETLSKFKDVVVQRHIARIESLVMDSFRQLLRKGGLIRAIHIEPKTFEVALRDDENVLINPERLSAGERQLFAVSLLWGLARAAGRPLPTVIDTPLGRLDGTHRDHLVQRYFPHASHQVLLLSTDEEIDEEYYKALKPYVGHSYRLVFNDKTKATQIEPGYFW